MLVELIAGLLAGAVVSSIVDTNSDAAPAPEPWRCDAQALARDAPGTVEAAAALLLRLGEITPQGADRATNSAFDTLRWALIGLYVHPATPPEPDRATGLVRAAVYVMATEGHPMPNTADEIARLEALLQTCREI